MALELGWKDALAVEGEGVLVQVSQHPLYSFFT